MLDRMLLTAAMLVTPGLAAAQVLTFEGIGSQPLENVPIGDFYNGGAGPNFGIAFSSNALAVCLDVPGRDCSNASRGGLGNPDSQGRGLFFLQGGEAYMNREAGFGTGFSFFYSAVNSGGSFSIYDGLNGTGNVLATLALPTTGSGGPGTQCLTNDFCPFYAAGITFEGIARSVAFAGVANQIVFDDVTFGSARPGELPDTTVPEPGTTALVATGFLGLLVARRRRRT